MQSIMYNILPFFTFILIAVYILEQGDGSVVSSVKQDGANYCGDSFSDALSCANACPGGIDSECPSGQTCYAEVSCSEESGDDEDDEDDDVDDEDDSGEDETDPDSDVKTRPGIYLEGNPPAKTQFRERKSTPRAVIVLHTTETEGDAESPDKRAENTASFISNRDTYGSYHMIGDTDSIIKLVRFRNAAFHDATGSNEWSVGISLAIKAEDWSTFDEDTSQQLVKVMAIMAARAASWMDRKGYGKPAAVRLTKAESDNPDASGFISHADRDPERRSDPGADFPWSEFFDEYEKRI